MLSRLDHCYIFAIFKLLPAAVLSWRDQEKITLVHRLLVCCKVIIFMVIIFKDIKSYVCLVQMQAYMQQWF